MNEKPKWMDILNKYQHYNFQQLLLDQTTLKKIKKTKNFDFNRYTHAIFRNIDNHMEKVQSRLHLMTSLQKEILKRINGNQEQSQQIADYKSALSQVYLFNQLNLETCSRIVRSFKKHEKIDIRQIEQHFQKRIRQHSDISPHLKSLNEINLHVETEQFAMDSMGNSKMVLLKNTIIIPRTQLYNFLLDVSNVLPLKSQNKINSISDRLIKSDFEFQQHMITRKKVQLCDFKTGKFYYQDNSVNENRLMESSSFDGDQKLTDQKLSENDTRGQFGIVQQEYIISQDNSLEIIQNLNCLDEKLCQRDLKDQVRAEKVKPFDGVVININGKFNPAQCKMFKTWMNKKSSTLYVLYSIEILLGALERSNDKIISQLESYPAFRDYIVQYNEEKAKAGIQRNLIRRDTLMEKKSINSEDHIRIMPLGKSFFSWMMNWFNPKTNRLNDVKNFMANERTFLNEYSLAFSIFTLGITIVKMDPEFQLIYICFTFLSLIMLSQSVFTQQYRIRQIKLNEMHQEKTHIFGPLLSYVIVMLMVAMIYLFSNQLTDQSILKDRQIFFDKSNLLFYGQGYNNFNDVYQSVDTKETRLTTSNSIQVLDEQGKYLRSQDLAFGDQESSAWDKNEEFILLASEHSSSIIFQDVNLKKSFDTGIEITSESITIIEQERNHILFWAINENNMLYEFQMHYKLDQSTNTYSFKHFIKTIVDLDQIIAESEIKFREVQQNARDNQVQFLDKAHSRIFVMNQSNKEIVDKKVLNTLFNNLEGLWVGYILEEKGLTQYLILCVDQPSQVYKVRWDQI